jgi:DNA-binding MarR family transcriptional regulator
VGRSASEDVAAALGLLLQRSFRVRLYGQLTEGIVPGLDKTTYPVLSGIDRAGPSSAADLALAVGLDRSGVSRRATRLEQAGLLARQPDPRDARAALLVLTAAGEQAIATMRARLTDAISASFSSWPAGQAEAFASALGRFVSDGPFQQPAEAVTIRSRQQDQ